MNSAAGLQLGTATFLSHDLALSYPIAFLGTNYVTLWNAAPPPDLKRETRVRWRSDDGKVTRYFRAVSIDRECDWTLTVLLEEELRTVEELVNRQSEINERLNKLNRISAIPIQGLAPDHRTGWDYKGEVVLLAMESDDIAAILRQKSQQELVPGGVRWPRAKRGTGTG